MIDITNIKTYGWEAAIGGMRNSRKSWDAIDSHLEGNQFIFGPNDLKLASKLAGLGGSHAKFRRMIYVSMDILAPLYWWKEFDTYKIGTVANSTSTMYSITEKEFTIDDFSHDHLLTAGMINLNITISCLNASRNLYFERSDEEEKRQMWWNMVQLLPSSYNQMRTVSMNYEVVSHMVHERLYHKLDEWQEFCRKMLNDLPYAPELIFGSRPGEVKDGNDTE